jgi:hypothetical protein
MLASLPQVQDQVELKRRELLGPGCRPRQRCGQPARCSISTPNRLCDAHHLLSPPPTFGRVFEFSCCSPRSPNDDERPTRKPVRDVSLYKNRQQSKTKRRSALFGIERLVDKQQICRNNRQQDAGASGKDETAAALLGQ